jgi:hypothetical protein
MLELKLNFRPHWTDLFHFVRMKERGKEREKEREMRNSEKAKRNSIKE